MWSVKHVMVPVTGMFVSTPVVYHCKFDVATQVLVVAIFFPPICNFNKVSTRILSAAQVTIATDLLAIYLRKHTLPPLLHEHGPLAKKLMYLNKYYPRGEMAGNKCTI